MTFLIYVSFVVFIIYLIHQYLDSSWINMDTSNDEFAGLRAKCKPKLPLLCTLNQNKKETTFIWHIKNFEMCPDQWGKSLKSPEFSIYNWQNPTFHILLYAGGVNEKSSKYLSMYLVKTSDDEENFTFSCKLGIVTTEDKKTCFEFDSKNLLRGNGKGVAECVERKKLLISERNIFLPDGCLTIFCEINVVGFNESVRCGNSSQLKDLSDVYAVIYENGKYCDAFLHVGEKTFKVHKAILEARFPDLVKNMDGNKCKIQNISSKTMHALLNYVYTGVLNMNELNLFEILSSNYVLPSHLKRLLLEKQTEIEATICFHKTVISFSWDIHNFSSLDSSKIIHYFLVGDYNIKCTWLDLFLSVTTDEKSDEYITISIQRFSKDCKRIVCTIKTSDEAKTFHHTYDKEDKWVLPNCFSKEMLRNSISDASSDDVNLFFEITVSNGTKTTELNKKELTLNPGSVNETVEDLKSLQKDLTSILKVPKYCDLTLISGKEKIQAHKFILAARSSVFCDIIESDTKKKNSEITVDDFDYSVIKDMLGYVYCNEVKFSIPGHEHIHNMYSAAWKYSLSGLEEECINCLKSNINAETAGDILISAHKWNDDELKEQVYNFVCTNPMQIANSKAWDQVMLKRSDLATEVLKKILTNLHAKVKREF